MFDAPIDSIWKYLSSQAHMHPSIRVLNREVLGNVVTLTSERTIMGRAAVVKVRNTIYPPIGMVQEFLEGPMRGSRAFQYYIPKGDKTGVTVVGDYVMAGAHEQTTRDAVIAQSKKTFEEDNAILKTIK